MLIINVTSSSKVGQHIWDIKYWALYFKIHIFYMGHEYWTFSVFLITSNGGENIP